MAERNFDDIQVLGREKKIITGSFRPNGAGAVDNTANVGKGFSVARTGVGAFTITLEDRYWALDSSHYQLALAVPAAAHDLCEGIVDVKVAKTLPFVHYSAGAAADIASDPANWIRFTLILSNSSVVG